VRSLCLDYTTFNDHMIDLAVIVSSLSFVFEIGVRASSDGVYCAMGREIVALVRRLTCLQWGWQWQIGLYLVLMC
jgi:hypothetical protein